MIKIAFSHLCGMSHEYLCSNPFAHRSHALNHGFVPGAIWMQGAEHGRPAEAVKPKRVHGFDRGHFTPCLHRGISTGRGCDENERLNTLRREAHDFSCNIAAHRKPDYREMLRRICKNVLGHFADGRRAAHIGMGDRPQRLK